MRSVWFMGWSVGWPVSRSVCWPVGWSASWIYWNRDDYLLRGVVIVLVLIFVATEEVIGELLHNFQGSSLF